MPKSAKVWFITGTSKAFGRIWAEAAPGRGEKVLATARHPESLSDIASHYGSNVLALDVTGEAGVASAVKEGHAQFGRPDVVVENADHGLR